MAQRYYSDDLITLALDGLRWIVKKDEQAWSVHPERYYLEIQYKGNNRTVQYPTKEERDISYENISSLLTPPPPTVDGEKP